MRLAEPVEILGRGRLPPIGGPGGGRLDARERPFDPPDGIESARVGHDGAGIAWLGRGAKRYG